MRRVMVLWVVAVVAATAAFLAHLTVRLETVRLGYHLAQERKEQRKLIEYRRVLQIELNVLKNVERLRTVAERDLGMTKPEDSHLYKMSTASLQGRNP